VQVLIVDDHEEARVMLRVGLSLEAGVKVVGEAASAAAGAALARQLRPHAVVLDLLLPDAEPRQAFAAVRAAAPSSRLVVFSAKETNREWYERQGANFFGKSSDRLEALLSWFRAEAAGD
jgi:DNA-binding NarL/FixJ family response regulator